MGSSQDVMRLYITREISGNFSQTEGWSVAKSHTLSGYNQVFFIERFKNGMKELVKLGVTFDRVVPQGMIDFMIKGSPEVSSVSGRQNRFELIVPKNTDISAVPASWKIHYMNTFGYDGESLIWNKKPVRKEKEDPAKKQAVPKPA
jgi:hypothetical protein